MTDPQTEARAFADDLGRRASKEQIVMHYHARQADKLAIALAAKDADNARLRAVISKVCEALNNGAFCSPDCSIEFMEVVPVEVESVVSSLRSQLAEANTALERALAERAGGVKPLPDDLFSHRDAWRKALELARDTAEVQEPDIDDHSYWQHELDVFDKVCVALAQEKGR